MGLWSKISRLFSDAEPEIASTPAPTVRQPAASYSSPSPDFGSPDMPAAPSSRPGKIHLDPSLITYPAAPATIPAPAAGEAPMDHDSLELMASMSSDIAKARMRVAGGAGYLTKEMIDRIELRKAEGIKFKEQRLEADRQGALAAKPSSLPSALPIGTPSRGVAPAPAQAPAPSMATQAPISMSTTQTGRYGAYRNDDDSLLFQMMYPELGVWRNPTSMQAWAVWMLSRDHGDTHFRGDGFRASVVDGNASANPTVRIVSDDGASMQARCQLSEGKLSALTPTGQTANFDFGLNAPCDISYDGGDGRGFDWGVDKGISASALSNDWGDNPASAQASSMGADKLDTSLSFDAGGSGSIDSGSGNAGSFDTGRANSGSWDDKPSEKMSTAY